MKDKYDVIVIGGGPAGTAAAIYFKNFNKNVIIIESSVPGGQTNLTGKITNYPGLDEISGVEFGIKLYEQSQKLEIEYEFGTISGIFQEDEKNFVLIGEKRIEAKYILIATGCSPRKLEEIKNFSKYEGKKIHFCASCDGAFYLNKTVAVIGGGNAALQDALILSNICKKVFIIHILDKFQADPITIERVMKKENIEIFLSADTKEFIEDKAGNFLGLEFSQKNNEIKRINADGAFLFIGRKPNTNFLPKGILSDDGFIITNDKYETTMKGIFAAGDCRKKNSPRQIATAIAEGATAAINISNID